MKTNIRAKMTLSALAVVLLVVAAASAQIILGGYKPIDTNAPDAINAADFAVAAQSENTGIEIQRGDLVKAERQTTAGANYRLCMQVIGNEDEPYFVQTVVNLDLKGNYKLTSWALSECGGPPATGPTSSMARARDNFKPVEIDAGVDLAADFAVKEHTKKTLMNFKLDEVVKAEDYEPKLGARNFRLCLKVTEGGKASFVRVIVNVDQYSNHKLVSWTASKCGEAASSAFKPISNGDAGAGLAADFAVKEQAKRTKTKIMPATIVKAEDQEPKLFYRNFRLCLKTTVDGKPTTAQAVITVDQYSNHKLISWAESKCGPSEDDFVQVANSDAGIGLAADFAVKKHSEDTGIKHTVAGILKAEEKGMFKMTYRVCMKVAEEGKTNIIQAVVTMDQYSNMKLVSWEHSKCGK